MSAMAQPALTHLPQDVLLMLTVLDPLRPELHAPLCASCKAVRHALAEAVDVLRTQCGALRATLAKTGYSAREIAAGASDLCWCAYIDCHRNARCVHVGLCAAGAGTARPLMMPTAARSAT